MCGGSTPSCAKPTGHANPSRATALAQAALSARPISTSSFVRLMSSKAPVHWFRSTMRPFLGAVNGWSQVLGLLITRLPTPAQRLVAIENLVDEHGHGDLSMSHVATFRRLIKSLDTAAAAGSLQVSQQSAAVEAEASMVTDAIKAAALKLQPASHRPDDSTLVGGCHDDLFSEVGSERSSGHESVHLSSAVQHQTQGSEEIELLGQPDHPAVARFFDVFKGTTTWQELAGALGK